MEIEDNTTINFDFSFDNTINELEEIIPSESIDLSDLQKKTDSNVYINILNDDNIHIIDLNKITVQVSEFEQYFSFKLVNDSFSHITKFITFASIETIFDIFGLTYVEQVYQNIYDNIFELAYFKMYDIHIIALIKKLSLKDYSLNKNIEIINANMMLKIIRYINGKENNSESQIPLIFWLCAVILQSLTNAWRIMMTQYYSKIAINTTNTISLYIDLDGNSIDNKELLSLHKFNNIFNDFIIIFKDILTKFNFDHIDIMYSLFIPSN